MNHALAFVLASTFLTIGSFQSSPIADPPANAPGLPHLVRVSIINMSGKNREARLRNVAVPLPVAQRVTLQVLAGSSITITSDTDQHVSHVIVVAAPDEGHLYPIN